MIPFRSRTVATFLGTLAVALLGATPAMAATITPNTFADEFGGTGACALRDAVQAANTDAGFGGCPAGSGADTIPLAAGTYELTIPGDEALNVNGDLDVTAGSTVTISHSGISPTAIDANGIDRILELPVPSAVATLSGLTIRGGSRSSGGSGGGIRNTGTLTVTDSTVTGNTDPGGVGAGGISNVSGGTTALTNVTISGNSSVFVGGGYAQNAGSTTMNNVTISANTADSDSNDDADGGGIFVTGGTVSLRNTIVAGNRDASPPAGSVAPDCSGPVSSLGNNLIGTTQNCGYVAGAGDKLNTNALLGPLADNGGSTFTHALLTGSPAINGAGPGAAPTDQRGVPRSSDIGAYELVSCGAVVVNQVGTSGVDSLTGTAAADGFLLLAGQRHRLRPGRRRRPLRRRQQGQAQGRTRQGPAPRRARQGQAQGRRSQGQARRRPRPRHAARRQGQRPLQGRRRQGRRKELLSSAPALSAARCGRSRS